MLKNNILLTLLYHSDIIESTNIRHYRKINFGIVPNAGQIIHCSLILKLENIRYLTQQILKAGPISSMVSS